MKVSYDHVSLRVTDLNRSIAFYRDLVGLELVSRRDGGSMAVLRVGEALLVLFCSGKYEEVDGEGRSGTDHVAFCVDAESYDLLLARLQQDDLVVRGPTVNSGAFGQGLATYFRDPDGHELEIKKYESKKES